MAGMAGAPSQSRLFALPAGQESQERKKTYLSPEKGAEMKSLSEAVGRARTLGAGLALVLTTAMAAHAQVNAVYVESNISTTNNNTIIGFSNDGSGNLTPLPGSPYT